MRWSLVLLVLLCGRSAAPQVPSQTELQSLPQPAIPAAAQSANLPPTVAKQPKAPEPQFSPQAAYEEAMQPLDITRRSVGNWSDAERAAMKIGVQLASVSCEKRRPGQFHGEELIAYARLCYLGEQWDLSRQAAASYRKAQGAATEEKKKTGFPSLATAFDYEVQASLRLEDSVRAANTAKTMLRTVAYDEMTSDATNAVALYTDQALAVLNQRQPILLSLLRDYVSRDPVAAANARPALSLNAIYADAIALPTLLQFVDQPKVAAASFAELEAALPPSLPSDDAIRIADLRRRYQLLGSPLPTIATYANLLKPASRPARDLDKKPSSAMVLLLFPEWCAQCIGMGMQFASTADRLSKKGASFYALLALDQMPPPALKPAATRGANSATGHGSRSQHDPQENRAPTAAELLAGTPTTVVPVQTLDRFVARDFPLIVVADRNGIVRSIQVVPETALQPDGLVDEIVGRVLEQWPLASTDN